MPYAPCKNWLTPPISSLAAITLLPPRSLQALPYKASRTTMVLMNRRVKQSSVIALVHFSRVSIKISSEQVKILGVSSYFSLPHVQKIDEHQSIQIDSLRQGSIVKKSP